MARIKKVKVHGPIGVYEHSDDNAPLEELANNDVILQERVDAAYVKLQDSLDVGFTRESYVPLQPERDGSKVYVNPGTFLCRMPVRSGPFEGEGRGAGSDDRTGEGRAGQACGRVPGDHRHLLGKGRRAAVAARRRDGADRRLTPIRTAPRRAASGPAAGRPARNRRSAPPRRLGASAPASGPAECAPSCAPPRGCCASPRAPYRPGTQG